MSAPTDPVDRGAATTAPRSAASGARPFWQELLLLLGVAIVLAIFVKTFFVQAFYVPSESMENTLVPDDRIVVQKVSYWFGGSPSRGDVIVFDDPGGWLTPDEDRAPSNPVARALEFVGLYPAGGHLVKRVIGVGGDHVVCCDSQGRITVNGVPLNELAYLPPGTKPSLFPFDVRVPQGYLWVQGDNRSRSEDSRAHAARADPGGGMVPVGDVVGKVFAVVWPFGHAKILHRPATFGTVR